MRHHMVQQRSLRAVDGEKWHNSKIGELQNLRCVSARAKKHSTCFGARWLTAYRNSRPFPG